MRLFTYLYIPNQFLLQRCHFDIMTGPP